MDCAMCLNKLTAEMYLELGCSHAYHRECWIEWEFAENTRRVLFFSTRDENDGQEINEQEIEIPGIRCPICNTVVDNGAIVYHAPQESDHESDEQAESIAVNPLFAAQDQDNNDESNLSFWDIFAPDPEDPLLGKANEDGDDQL